MDVTIYHNPACGTSRTVLGTLRDAGIEPTIIEYLKTPPSRKVLKELLASMKMTPRELLRRRGTPHDELGLGHSSVSDEAILDAIEAHPILIERPIVVSPMGARVCRPAERLREIMPIQD